MSEHVNEYKLLQDFDEIVPGMIFETFDDSENKFKVIAVEDNLITYSFKRMGTLTSLNNIQHFICQYKLIYDPRNKSKEDIQKEICQKESELASLKEKLKEMNRFKFVKGKFYKVRFDEKSLFGYYDGIVFNNFGNVYWVHHYDTYTDISNGNLGEKLEQVYEVLGNPTLSELVSGNYKTTNNLIKDV